jgi:hypothetical protein
LAVSIRVNSGEDLAALRLLLQLPIAKSIKTQRKKKVFEEK